MQTVSHFHLPAEQTHWSAHPEVHDPLRQTAPAGSSLLSQGESLVGKRPGSHGRNRTSSEVLLQDTNREHTSTIRFGCGSFPAENFHCEIDHLTLRSRGLGAGSGSGISPSA